MNDGVQLLPVGSDPNDQHAPEGLMWGDYPGKLYRLESDGTRYEIFVVEDPNDPEYVRVMHDHGNGHGEWARMGTGGAVASSYVNEKFGPRNDVDLYHLTRLIAYALGRPPHQEIPLEAREL
jgi:hypothetical protein